MKKDKTILTINPAEANELAVKAYSDSVPDEERINAAWEYGKICGAMTAAEEALAESTGKTYERDFEISAAEAATLDEIIDSVTASISERTTAAQELGRVYGYLEARCKMKKTQGK